MTNIEITGHEEDVVKRLVDSGRYKSPEQAVKMSLRLLDEHEAEQEDKLKRLREFVAEGMEEYNNGDIAPLDMEAIIEEAEAKHADKNPDD